MKLPATRAISACLLALVASAAMALPVVRKTPGGPWVVQSGGDFVVPAGQPVQWAVRICNDLPTPITASLQDYLHSGECAGHDQLALLCPPLTVGNGTLVACDDAASPPVVQPALDVQGMTLAPNECVDVLFETRVDLLAPVGSTACNVGVYATDSGTPDGSGQTSPPTGAGCSCVVVTTPITTEMTLSLWAQVDAPPFVEGDAESTVTLDVEGINLTARDAVGRFVLPVPQGLTFDAALQCPPGATCGLNASGEFEISNLVVSQGGGFTARLRMRGNCGSIGVSRICLQGYFEPIEDTSRRIVTTDRGGPGESPTCIKPVPPAFDVWKTWRLTDRDGNGVPSAGDRIRFLITAWNRGQAPGRDVVIVDSLPLGYDRSATGPEAVAVDAGGTYAGSQASWTFAEVGPGSVVSAWVEATMLVDSVAANRARLSSRVLRDCGGSTVLSDNPLTAAVDDATAVGPGTPLPVATKDFTLTDADGDGVPSPGDSVRWSIVVVNQGTATATGVDLADALPACLGDATGVSVVPAGGGADASTPRSVSVTGLGGPDGLQPDEAVTVSFTTPVVTAAGCCNQATVTWAGGTMAGVSRDPRGLAAPEPTCLSPTSALARFEKEAFLFDADGNGRPTPGDRVRYEVRLRNDGAATPDCQVHDEVPAAIELDPASIVPGCPSGCAWSYSPPPMGQHGGGRVSLELVRFGIGDEASIAFEGTIAPTASGDICNQASLVVAGMLAPRLSEDVTTGGPTCLRVEAPQPPALVATLVPSGPLADECARPGEEVIVSLTVEAVGGNVAAENVTLDLADITGLTVVDAGGGVPAPGTLSWADIGSLAAGGSATRVARLLVPCGVAGDIDLAPAVSASNVPSTPGLPWQVTLADADPQASLALTHDDTDGDGVLDPGESLLAEITLTEGAGCGAGDVQVALALDPALAVVEVRDGGVAGASSVAWTVSPLDAGATAVVAVVLTLDAAAADCSEPAVDPSATWLASAGACPDVLTWTPGPLATPPGPCDPPDSSDLLRDATAGLDGTTLAGLPALLDASGVDDTCVAGTVSRLADTTVVAVDVGALLGTGIDLAAEALPAGTSHVVFYEVSRSCASIRACKVDADADPSNGLESVRISTAGCSP